MEELASNVGCDGGGHRVVRHSDCICAASTRREKYSVDHDSGRQPALAQKKG